MEKSPQCQTHTMTSVMRAIAPFSPKTSINICSTGWPASLSTVLSKFWIEKSREMRRKKPKIAEHPTDIRTPIGAFQEALVFSSERCAEASNPVILSRGTRLAFCPGLISSRQLRLDPQYCGWQNAEHQESQGRNIRVLAHKHTACSDICRGSSLTPPDWITGTIVESGKDKFRGLMSGCFSKKSYREA